MADALPRLDAVLAASPARPAAPRASGIDRLSQGSATRPETPPATLARAFVERPARDAAPSRPPAGCGPAGRVARQCGACARSGRARCSSCCPSLPAPGPLPDPQPGDRSAPRTRGPAGRLRRSRSSRPTPMGDARVLDRNGVEVVVPRRKAAAARWRGTGRDRDRPPTGAGGTSAPFPTTSTR